MRPETLLTIKGLVITGLGLCGYVFYRRRFRRIPRSMRKAWEKAERRFYVLRFASAALYIAGVVVTVTGLAMTVRTLGSAKHTVSQSSVSLQPIAQDAPNPAQVLKLVNEQRKANHLTELVLDPGLTAVARERLEDMVKNQYYGHQGSSGKYFYDLFASHGFSTGYSCENLDIEPSTDPSGYIADWLSSTEGHKECMLNSAVTKAGYAAGKYGDIETNGTPHTYYIVVAIHAAPPFKSVL